MDKMGLIVFAATGHVLGAFTRQGDPEGALDPEMVAGEGVWIRDEETGERLVTVEPRHLAVEVVDRSDRVLLDWQQYVVEDGVPDQKAERVQAVDLDGTHLVLTLNADATEDLDAWFQVEGGAGEERIVQPFKIMNGEGNTLPVREDLPLANGDYGVLVLVPGLRAHIAQVSIP